MTSQVDLWFPHVHAPGTTYTHILVINVQIMFWVVRTENITTIRNLWTWTNIFYDLVKTFQIPCAMFLYCDCIRSLGSHNNIAQTHWLKMIEMSFFIPCHEGHSSPEGFEGRLLLSFLASGKSKLFVWDLTSVCRPVLPRILSSSQLPRQTCGTTPFLACPLLSSYSLPLFVCLWSVRVYYYQRLCFAVMAWFWGISSHSRIWTLGPHLYCSGRA